MSHSPQELYYQMAIENKSTQDKENKKLGRLGEKKACKYLKRQGYKILERNYNNPFGEVDIIARKGDIIAFVEVKTRLSDKYGSPSEAVNGARKRKYVLAANYYLQKKLDDYIVRFDVIEVFRGEINHIESAFTA